MEKCPICGCEGEEVSRMETIHEGKLAEEVTYACWKHKCVIRFHDIDADSIRDYPHEGGRGGINRRRNPMYKAADTVNRRIQKRMSASDVTRMLKKERTKEPINLIPTADAIDEVEKVLSAEDRALNRKKKMLSRIRKFGE